MADKKDTEKKPRERKPRNAAADVKVEKKPSRKSKADDAAPELPLNSLQDIGKAMKESEAAPQTFAAKPQAEPAERKPKIDAKGRSYGTGRRKNAVARVWLKRGSGKVIVNDRDQNVYFARQTHRLILNQPFLIVNSVGLFDVIATVKGGGLSGQAGAVRHGISRALENFDPALRPSLKKAGMLTRDSRIVERKKVGMHGARRTKQWAKR